MHSCWTASLCVAPRANSAAIPLSSRLASPVPHRSRCSGGSVQGLRAARGQNPPGIRAAMHSCWTASLCVAPRANSAAIPLSSRLASPVPHRSRCSGGSVQGLRAARGQNPPGIRAAMHSCWTASLCVAPRANSAAIPLSSRLASPVPHRSRCSGGSVQGLRAARGQNPPGIRAAMHSCWTASLCVAPRANSAAIPLSSRLASPVPHRSRCSGGSVQGLVGTPWHASPESISPGASGLRWR